MVQELKKNPNKQEESSTNINLITALGEVLCSTLYPMFLCFLTPPAPPTSPLHGACAALAAAAPAVTEPAGKMGLMVKDWTPSF